MIIKSFTAESAAAALKDVRAQMGGEAVVLKTRQVTDEHGRPAIEVTACLDRPSVAQTSQILSRRRSNRVAQAVASSRLDEGDVATATAAKQPAAENEAGAPTDESQQSLRELEARLREQIEASNKSTLEQIANMLTGLSAATTERATGSSDETMTRLLMQLQDADVPETFTTALLSTLHLSDGTEQSPVDAARKSLTESLADMMQPHLDLQPGDTVVVTGPSGVGKTSLIGKLAAQLVAVEKKKVRLVSLDDVKVGAHDEIASYAAILGVELTEPTGTNEKLAAYNDCITLIDTHGLPTDAAKLAAFTERVGKTNATHRIAVISALMRSADVADVADAMRALEPTQVAVTMLDCTHRHGSIVAACDSLNVKLVWLAQSPAGVGTLHVPDPARLATTLIPEEVSHE